MTTVADTTRPNYGKVKEMVEKVIKDNFIDGPPVSIVDIARNYGLDVFEASFPLPFKDVCGYINLEDRTVAVNNQDSVRRQRFTIAHELGHWLLHRDIIERDPDLGILYRVPIGQDEDNPLEKEANAFAAHLLVPRKDLEKYLSYDAVDDHRLAKIFGVSAEVIRYRRIYEKL